MAGADLTLHLADLPPGHSEQQGTLDLVVLDAAGEEEPHALHVVCDVEQLGLRVHVRGQVRGRAQSTCHRCLGRFERPLDASFDLVLQKGGAADESEDLVAIPEAAAEYDLVPHVREAVILEEPMRLLCRPDCRGLCLRCGADLNQGPCGCTTAGDPRWAPLAALRRRL
jgi:uncharacterized protein